MNTWATDVPKLCCSQAQYTNMQTEVIKSSLRFGANKISRVDCMRVVCKSLYRTDRA